MKNSLVPVLLSLLLILPAMAQEAEQDPLYIQINNTSESSLTWPAGQALQLVLQYGNRSQETANAYLQCSLFSASGATFSPEMSNGHGAEFEIVDDGEEILFEVRELIPGQNFNAQVAIDLSQQEENDRSMRVQCRLRDENDDTLSRQRLTVEFE
ncbi:MAG: hypothetical protein KC496_03315 [Anaerolineae bacterium]|nr:hypothetical protein [Anaerolineae bacterium]